MAEKDEQTPTHPLEKLLETVVINCQHIAAICKGLCVKGVSYDVSVKELERHKDAESSAAKILKEESEHCQSVLSDCVIQLDTLKKKYLADYNKSNGVEKLSTENGNEEEAKEENGDPQEEGASSSSKEDRRRKKK
jgi:hypothetical protein